jgi:putative ATPase
MPREGTRSLFDEPDELPEPPAGPDAPLAERMRPRTLDEYVGQGHLLGQGRLIRKLVDGNGPLPSLILWEPPGTGKTTLARLLSGRSGTRFVPLSAVLSGVKELREAIAEAREAKRRDDARSCSSTKSTDSTKASRTPFCRRSRTEPSPW